MDEKIFISLTKSEFINIIKEAVREELSSNKKKELLTFREACEFLGCSASGLNKWKSQNKIPYKKLGERIFFNRQELLDSMKGSNYPKSYGKS